MEHPGPNTKRLRAYKTELDPNNAQRTMFLQHCGVARFVYNWALADRIDRFRNTGESTNLYEQKRRFNALKDAQFPWIRETAYAVTAESFAHLDTAYKNFFVRIKKGGEKPGFPKFKSKAKGPMNFTMRGSIHIEEQRIKLPRIGWIRLKEAEYLPVAGAKILSANISERAGHWFVSLQVEQEIMAPKPAMGPVIGLDLGLKSLAVCSDGSVFENCKPLLRHEARMKRAQRELCRRKKGGKNRDKTRQKIAKLHAKITNIRQHHIHDITYRLTAKMKPAEIVIEDLNVKGMVQNHHLSKAISDASFGEFRRQLAYKAQWHGIDLVIADRFYASSKTCSACGEKKPLLRLSDRTFVCEACGVTIDRDLNAALNLAQMAGKRSVTACGGDSAGVRRDTKLAPRKQEPGGRKASVLDAADLSAGIRSVGSLVQ